VSDGLSELKEEDVQRLARLIESLESSKFDYMQLQVGDMKVTLGKGAVPMSAPAIAAPDAPDAPAYAPPARPASAAAAPPPVETTPPGKRAADAAPAGTIEIKSQIMGMFYPQPEPGSPPFVSIGTEVKENTTVCLIEVMKTFNAMTAGVKGVITEICVENAQLVEYGQVLFRVRPS
jgi:acetyl-CoA carboxylase biotin carboxyl carrier protein